MDANWNVKVPATPSGLTRRRVTFRRSHGIGRSKSSPHDPFAASWPFQSRRGRNESLIFTPAGHGLSFPQVVRKGKWVTAENTIQVLVRKPDQRPLATP